MVMMRKTNGYAVKCAAQLVAIVVAISSHSASVAADLWNFEFTPDSSLPYDLSGDTFYGRADVAGSFTLRLDWQRLTGQLVESVKLWWR